MFTAIVPFSVNLSKWILLCLMCLPTIIFADNWQIKVYADNYIEVSNFWNKDVKELEILITSETFEATYIGKIYYSGSQKKGLHFPYDFSFEGKDTILDFDSTYWRINILDKKNKIASESFQYSNNEHSLLQFKPIQLQINTLKSLNIWGNTIDSFTWNDKLGEQLVVRSYISNLKDSINFKTYIYLYVFQKNEMSDTWTLQKKVTDYMLYSNGSNEHLKNLKKIQLTDVNCDSIGEISHGYFTNLSEVDSLRTFRMVLLNQQQKYVANSSFTKKPKKNSVSIDIPQFSDEIYKRYLVRMINVLAKTSIKD